MAWRVSVRAGMRRDGSCGHVVLEMMMGGMLVLLFVFVFMGSLPRQKIYHIATFGETIADVP